MKVPRVESKLRVFSFKIQFLSQVTEFKKSLNAVNSACEEVRKSVKLKEIMKKILFLGNTLNQGTTRGSAIGFKLDSLLKLTDTHASNNKMTLMHYLCKVQADRSPGLLDFHLDLVSLEAATKVLNLFQEGKVSGKDNTKTNETKEKMVLVQRMIQGAMPKQLKKARERNLTQSQRRMERIALLQNQLYDQYLNS
ncbi:hypothetical protein HN873_051623 [Arachis hypogaea]